VSELSADLAQQLTAARALLAGTALDGRLSQPLRGATDARVEALRRALPPGRFLEAVIAQVTATKPVVVAREPGGATRLYAQNITVAQLQAATMFYVSDAGKRLQLIESRGRIRQLNIAALGEFDRAQMAVAARLCRARACASEFKPGFGTYVRAMAQTRASPPAAIPAPVAR